ncbi:MAG: membrane protein insertase YidC [Verrucomicrobia bacterium]|jgi:YidC/Oxa1 family membrane protein insertase|nr:membrane protein insertase YidC [Verrucomicrobiota bacterium]
MDRKSIIVIAGCMGLIALWSMVIVPKLYPPKPLPPRATNEVSTAASAPPVAASNVEQAATSAPPVAPSKPVFVASGDEETLVLTNDNARYTFTSQGGGLKFIELVKYPETVSRSRKKQPLTNDLAGLNAHVSIPVLAVLGDESVQGDGIFTLTKTAAGGVRAEKTLTNGLRIIKEFKPTTNYLVSATVQLENTSGAPLKLPPQEWTIGTATPMGPDDKDAAQNMGLMWYDGAAKQEIAAPWFDNASFLSCVGATAKQPRSEYVAGRSNVVWASVHNQFFALVAMPQEPAQQIVSRPLELPRPGDDEIPPNQKNAPPPKGLQTAFLYPSVTLDPGKAVERHFHFFAGPKEYQTLAHIANRFQNNVDLVMGFGGFFGFFSKALLLGMNWLHHTFMLGYGWAIIVITIIFKVLFWPLTQASTRSMKRLQALQPQMAAIKEKYKDDPVKMNKKTMEFMKENKVSPLGGCLPMVLQMPVFIGFFYMIRSAIELRGASFLWVADLSRPDTLFTIPGTSFPFNLLPLLMGGTMLWQSHLTPPSPGMDPTQQKMMRYLPLIFLFMLYNYSSGLALYWTVQNLLTIVQTKLTKTAASVAPTTPQVSVLTPLSKKKK